MMTATFNGNSGTIIISCYSANHASDETDLIGFYNALSSLIRSILKHNVQMISGDMKT